VIHISAQPARSQTERGAARERFEALISEGATEPLELFV
jgi:hypothetical protein